MRWAALDESVYMAPRIEFDDGSVFQEGEWVVKAPGSEASGTSAHNLWHHAGEFYVLRRERPDWHVPFPVLENLAEVELWMSRVAFGLEPGSEVKVRVEAHRWVTRGIVCPGDGDAFDEGSFGVCLGPGETDIGLAKVLAGPFPGLRRCEDYTRRAEAKKVELPPWARPGERWPEADLHGWTDSVMERGFVLGSRLRRDVVEIGNEEGESPP